MELTLADAIRAEANAHKAWLRARGTPAASDRLWRKWTLAKATLAAMTARSGSAHLHLEQQDEPDR